MSEEVETDKLFSYEEFLEIFCGPKPRLAASPDIIKNIGRSFTQFDDNQVLEAWRQLLHITMPDFFSQLPSIIRNIDPETRRWILENNPKLPNPFPVHDFKEGDLVIFKPAVSFWSRWDAELIDTFLPVFDGNIDAEISGSTVYYPHSGFAAEAVRTSIVQFTTDWVAFPEEYHFSHKERSARDIFNGRLNALESQSFAAGVALAPKDIDGIEITLQHQGHPAKEELYTTDETSYEYKYGIVTAVRQIPNDPKYGDNVGKLAYCALFESHRVWCLKEESQLRPPKYANINEWPERLAYWDPKILETKDEC